MDDWKAVRKPSEAPKSHRPLLRSKSESRKIVGRGFYGPAPARNSLELLLDDQEIILGLLRLAHLKPVGIGIEAKVVNGHLPLIRNMGGDPGNELQVVHPLLLCEYPRPQDRELDQRKGKPVLLPRCP
jgi:hypothetical protein